MIKLYLGNVGSGKTACAVREMMLNKKHIHYYTNISTTKKHPHIHKITAENLIKKEITYGKLGKKNVSLSFNKEFWINIPKPISIVIDEAHIFLNPRRSMSKLSQIMLDFVSLARRFSESSTHQGDLIFITQLGNRVDYIIREMSHHVVTHVCFFTSECMKCGLSWNENSNLAEPIELCPSCGHYRINKKNHKIVQTHYASIGHYENARDFGSKTYYRRMQVNDIQETFGKYDSLQWDDLISDMDMA